MEGESKSAGRMTLDQVYTALLTQTVDLPDRTNAADRVRDLGVDGSIDEAMAAAMAERGRGRRLSAVEQLNRHNRLVLLGAPGSGKSSFVKYVALCLAGEVLGNQSGSLALLTEPLPQEPDEDKQDADEQDADEEKEPQPQPWDHGAPLPVLVVLRQFAATHLPPAGQPASANHIWQYIADELCKQSLDDFVKPLRQHLQKEGGLILFDGLDEVPEAESRRQQIIQAVEDFAAVYGQCRILVTSRPYAYREEDWALADFDVATLEPFEPAQIRAFVKRWYHRVGQVRNLGEADAQGRAVHLQETVLRNERLADLAKQPLLLTLMANLHAYRGGTLPQKREQLYSEAVKLLLDWWEQQRVVRDESGSEVVIQPSLVEYLNIGHDNILSVLSQLAFEAHKSNPDPNHRATIRQADLIQALMNVSTDKNLRYEQLIDHLSHRTGLLLPESNHILKFPHRTFQEYLAALHLTGSSYPNEVADLARQDPSRWREVLLLAGAHASSGNDLPIWALAETLCHRSPDEAEWTKADEWGAHLAGIALAESANLETVHPRDQSKLNRVRQGLVHVIEQSDLEPLTRAEAGRTLAHLGDPRDHVMTVEAMHFCHVPAGPFLNPLEEHNETELDYDYWLARYPVTQAQFSQFVAEGGYKNEAYWAEAIEEGYWSSDGFKGRYDGIARTEPYRLGIPFKLPNHPAVGMTWREAMAFCRWLTEALQQGANLPGDFIVSLPQDNEWRKVAVGGVQIPQTPSWQVAKQIDWSNPATRPTVENPVPQRRYPWGESLTTDHTNFEQTKIGSTTAIGCFGRGAGPYGHEELSGSVWEWLLSRPGDIAGGAYYVEEERITSSARRDRYPGRWLISGRGFRCVVVPSSLRR